MLSTHVSGQNVKQFVFLAVKTLCMLRKDLEWVIWSIYSKICVFIRAWCRELTTLFKQVGCDKGLELKVTVVEAKVGQEQAEEGKGKWEDRQLNGGQVGVDKRTV